ncbi:MAG: c-type cytochrome [Hylemonella sp.]|uniref:c-type cytochrome n=1 Tax=Hylemonella sp. TaxID=2066020 RepID=UPI00391B21AB
MRPLTASARPIVATLTALLLASCAVEWENPKPARQLAQEEQPPGSVYLGWRVYQDRCAACHGVAAQGTANAPNLLRRLQTLGPREFVSLVLYRYDATLQGEPAATRGTREPQVEVLMERKNPPLAMPAWREEPRVNAHVLDLYAYLSGRAEGRVGPGKPTP